MRSEDRSENSKKTPRSHERATDTAEVGGEQFVAVRRSHPGRCAEVRLSRRPCQCYNGLVSAG